MSGGHLIRRSDGRISLIGCLVVTWLHSQLEGFLWLDVWWSHDCTVRWEDFSDLMSDGHMTARSDGRISLIGCPVVTWLCTRSDGRISLIRCLVLTWLLTIRSIGRISLIGCLVVSWLYWTVNWKDFSDWMSGGHMTSTVRTTPSDGRIFLIRQKYKKVK